ncbi:aminoacyl-tRNA hydrolase [Litorilinea aerophila]|uniref:Aminoacyl-tRNA hydrolase n=1 Tax=Litorilinea aerophila TaxID=1204385 RepID=A0A540VDB2_9CHLR|nr:alternative ribosome rescue aminoacyl-tRNA hydrolase ArfB [Litorilinea aerophila]MCC9077458.1 aminoacyl-tRNA hydrolase [Litorilinea aerophila]OUC06994.1 hypothetical protein RY27_17605 [Litorilinea aerophila]GIV77573.1 MAG: aminoacyl-tRNA hydrolase [Litorilinea sp.]
MIAITPEVTLDENELQWEFIRSGGPGGQNVNKVATAVQLRFDVLHSPSLPEEVRQRLLRLARNRVTKEGVLVIEARRYRSQRQNRAAALEELVDLIRQASRRPKRRRPTRPSQAARQQRLAAKRRRSLLKRNRRPPSPDEG